MPKHRVWRESGVVLMKGIKWENSRRGVLHSPRGEIKIHIRKPFKTALTYGVFLDDNTVPLISDTTLEGCKELVTKFFAGSW
jgi:hypothetical protein